MERIMVPQFLLRSSPAADQIVLRSRETRLFRDALLGLGLVLYPATQLRLNGLPLGTGEVFLFAWLAVSLPTQLARGLRQGNRALWRVTGFWAVVMLAESIGLVSGLARDLFQDVPAMLHDVFAYSLMIAIGTALTLELAEVQHRWRVCRLVTILGAVVLLMQLAGGFGLAPLPGADYWYFDRFTGWSDDANQLGFTSVFLTVTSLYVAWTAPSRGQAISALVCASVALVVGELTKSDSFTISLLVGASVWAAVTALNWLRSLETGVTVRGASVLVVVFGLPLAATAVVPFATTAMDRIGRSFDTFYNQKTDDQAGETRLLLWQEALERGTRSWFIGYGPGPQLTSKYYKRPPPSKFESHNTYLELFTQGGLLAGGAVAWLCSSTLLAACRARVAGMAALASVFATFCFFHFLLRHPIFWFGIVLCLLESERATARAGQQAPMRV